MPELRQSLKIPRTLAQNLLSALQTGAGNGWVSKNLDEYFLYLGTDRDWSALVQTMQKQQETPFARFGGVTEPKEIALWYFRMAEAEKGVLTLAVEDQDGAPRELAIDGD
ncbi:hypothetical protein AB4090_07955 [Acidithiobacillus sp. IBUN Pt1247-S3]|uniref:hypothetical protein n=1 Tax=Acidithiobacillus sp. IBUN Pt1247-S3 TaxID=3166642 RepID=UPI0034E60B53